MRKSLINHDTYGTDTGRFWIGVNPYGELTF